MGKKKAEWVEGMKGGKGELMDRRKEGWIVDWNDGVNLYELGRKMEAYRKEVKKNE